MRQHTLIVQCDSCGTKRTVIGRCADTAGLQNVGFYSIDYCVGIDQGPLGAEKEYATLDFCKKCFPHIPSDSRTNSFGETIALIAQIRAGSFRPKKKVAVA